MPIDETFKLDKLHNALVNYNTGVAKALRGAVEHLEGDLAHYSEVKAFVETTLSRLLPYTEYRVGGDVISRVNDYMKVLSMVTSVSKAQLDGKKALLATSIQFDHELRTLYALRSSCAQMTRLYTVFDEKFGANCAADVATEQAIQRTGFDEKLPALKEYMTLLRFRSMTNNAEFRRACAGLD